MMFLLGTWLSKGEVRLKQCCWQYGNQCVSFLSLHEIWRLWVHSWGNLRMIWFSGEEVMSRVIFSVWNLHERGRVWWVMRPSPAARLMLDGWLSTAVIFRGMVHGVVGSRRSSTRRWWKMLIQSLQGTKQQERNFQGEWIESWRDNGPDSPTGRSFWAVRAAMTGLATVES